MILEDLALVCPIAPDFWQDFRGGRILVSGCSGFFGCWITELLVYANHRFDLGLEVYGLTRDPRALFSRMPHLISDESFHVIEGDVRSFEANLDHLTHVVHCALVRTSDAQEMTSENILAMKKMLLFSSDRGARRFLYTSSGSVYDNDCQPQAGSFGAMKLDCERECLSSGYDPGLAVTIARGFAFAGPYLELDRGFAFSDLMRDALSGAALTVRGDGSSVRSYLYGADLAVWLLTILAQGDRGTIWDVGSREALSILELACKMKDVLGLESTVLVTKENHREDPRPRYVPDTQATRLKFGLSEKFNLDAIISRWAIWHSKAWPPGKRF